MLMHIFDWCTFAIAECLLFAHDYFIILFGICARYAFVMLLDISARLVVWAHHAVLVRCIVWARLYCLCLFVSRFVDWSFESYVLSFCLFVLIYIYCYLYPLLLVTCECFPWLIYPHKSHSIPGVNSSRVLVKFLRATPGFQLDTLTLWGFLGTWGFTTLSCGKHEDFLHFFAYSHVDCSVPSEQCLLLHWRLY